jgi:pimeloyl-ACP methyl ester carboxylesterase
MKMKYPSGWVVVNEVRALRETVYGVKTHYVHAGEGEPILLVHGAGPGAYGEAGWYNAIPVLAQHFHVYAMDLIGYGLTDKPLIDYSYQTCVNHIAGFVDALNLDRINIVGNSQGAYEVMKYTLDNPKRVKRVALVASGTLATAMGILERGRSTPLPRFDGSKETLRQFIEVIVNDPSKITDELVDARYEVACLPGHREMRESMNRYSQLLREDPDEQQVFDVSARLPKLTIPWCMIWGEDDQSAPYETLGKGLHNMFPDVPFHPIKNAGHQVQNDQPEECNAVLLDFFGAGARQAVGA